MTDSVGQLTFDFGTLVRPSNGRATRIKLKAEEAVPAEWLKVLCEVRRKTGIPHKEIAAKTGYSDSFSTNALNNQQRVSFEEYAKLKDALADIIFQKILEA